MDEEVTLFLMSHMNLHTEKEKSHRSIDFAAWGQRARQQRPDNARVRQNANKEKGEYLKGKVKLRVCDLEKYHFSEQLCLGRRKFFLPNRRCLERGGQGRIDLGPFFSRSRKHYE